MFENRISSINILSWNLKGFKQKIDGDTINKLKDQEVIDFLDKYDIVLLEETHMDKKDEEDIFLPGFSKPHNFPRPKRKQAISSSGGISLFIKENLGLKTKLLPRSSSDIVWMQICTQSNKQSEPDIFLGCVYIPPEHSSFGKDFTDKLWDNLETDLEELSAQGSILLMGDFNARTGELIDYVEFDDDNLRYSLPSNYVTDSLHRRLSMDKTVHKYGRKLVNISLNNNLFILNGRSLGDIYGKFTCYTPQGPSVVDYFLCSQELFKDVMHMKVKDLQIFSDHCPLELKIRLPYSYRNPKENFKSKDFRKKNNEKENIEELYLWNDNSNDKLQHTLNLPNFKDKLSEILKRAQHMKQDQFTANSTGINHLTDELTLFFQEIAQQSLCKKIRKQNKTRRKKNNKKWFDKECYLQRKELKSLLNALNRHPFNKTLCQKYYSMRKKYNSTIKKAKGIFKNNLVSKLNDEFNKDPSTMWKTLKELKSMGEPIKSNNHNINPLKWINHLEKLIGMETKVTEERKQIISNEKQQIQKSEYNSYLDRPITKKEIMKECRSLKNKKSPGNDNITNEIIKASIGSTIEIITTLFNLILDTGHYPVEWKNGLSIAIYKNGDPLNPGNYRGITLTSNLGKLFCKIINSRITNYLEDNELLIKEQAGFRKGLRTDDQIFILKKIVDDIIKTKNGRLYACFVDFQKAFDNVWHDALLLKLHKIGIKGRCFNVIKNMYTNSTICTKLKNGLSPSITVKKGVQQGNTLSPTLFNIFINDITENLPDFDSPPIGKQSKNKISCLLYADDLVLLSKTKGGLQTKLDHLNNYCEKWGLKINTDKTKVLVFCRTNTNVKTLFKCGLTFITIADQYKYLGIVFNQNGSLQKAQEHQCKQANKASHLLRRMFRKENVQIDTALHLFDSLVNPILTYGSSIWFPYNYSNKSIDNIEKFFESCFSRNSTIEDIHIKFCRCLLGVHRKTMCIPVLAELGRFPLALRMLTQTISYWTHILQSKRDSFVHQVYDDMFNNPKEDSWLIFIKSSLSRLGFNHVWQNQSTFDTRKLQFAIQMKLQSEYIRFWNKAKSKGSARLRFYSNICDTYEIQSYLTMIENRNHRTALSRLRTSSHNLKIETGRHHNIQRENRLCMVCNIVEDEYHLLDECVKFHESREKFKKDVTNIDVDYINYKPSEIFMDKDVQICLGRFVAECFRIHSNVSITFLV